MTNLEKHKDEIIECALNEGLCELTREKIKECDEWCKSIVPGKCEHCISKFWNWLAEEYKEPIKITITEYYILKGISIGNKYKYIAREKNGDLYLYDLNPYKEEYSIEWEVNSNIFCQISSFNHLFQFIKWEDEEPYNIQELIENSVIEDEKKKGDS